VNGKPKGWKSGGDAPFVFLPGGGKERRVPGPGGGSATAQKSHLKNFAKVAWDNSHILSETIGECGRQFNIVYDISDPQHLQHFFSSIYTAGTFPGGALAISVL
jgi:hypothetical protein